MPNLKSVAQKWLSYEYFVLFLHLYFIWTVHTNSYAKSVVPNVRYPCDHCGYKETEKESMKVYIESKPRNVT